MEINKEQFWEIIKSETPVCMPCKILGAIFEKLNTPVYKINIQEFPDIASKYGVKSIPNVKVFKGGQIVDEFLGARSEEFVTEFVKKYN